MADSFSDLIMILYPEVDKYIGTKDLGTMTILKYQVSYPILDHTRPHLIMF